MLLALVLLCGLIPAVAPTAEAAGWAQGYLDTLSGWGVMRGDIQNGLDPDRDITRAEFVAIMNRAYGYKDMKGTPFTDVPVSAWYADDIDIAYTVGYFNGTSATTASPNATLTREQAAVLLARNLMLQPTVGESLGFSDSRELSAWSRGLIGAAAEIGVINGYSDGSFRPNGRITRGEVAAMVARSLGTLIKDSGDHSLSSVYGNVTINQPGVNLRNTVIVGNLYLTGGIGLGDVLLENVTVYGQIIVAGAGESNASRSSVILRNVVANKLVVDNISNQFVTVRAEGDTDIAQTSIRTNAYVEDTTPDGYGLKLIEIDGENGIRVQLAGNIKEAVNLTPESSLQIVQGVAKKVTIDEKATNSTVNIYSGARIDELNLDVSTSVSGEGDIGHLQIGAPDCSVSMLPDEITIRPGLDATIGGIIMDSNTASESSADPRLLAGYPAARNVAPTSATLVASTNKTGTVYWAVTALADGSVGEDDVIKPPVYGGNIILSGNISAAKSKTEYTAPLNKLTSDGSYYISSIMVDARGNRSPLKVTAFTTPDDTVPAFTTGYPVMTKITSTDAQVTAMTNKSCLLYYVVLPSGSTTPSTQEMKSGALTGNLGYGVVNMLKNSTQPINVNNRELEELTKYDLYLWLTDADGAKSSTVQKMTFTTLDGTPPKITDFVQTDSTANSIKASYTLSERATFYWAIVPEGNETFMTFDYEGDEATPEQIAMARVKLESGVGALQSGNIANRDSNTFTISRLDTATTETTSYTIYIMAKDAAGNYSDIEAHNVRTMDTTPPTVEQEFTKFNGDDKNAPLADTDIRLVFSETIQAGSNGKNVFMELYQAVVDAVAENNGDDERNARNELADALSSCITMYHIPTLGREEEVTVRTEANEANDDWVVDYRYARVTMERGKMVITLPTEKDELGRCALNLDSGATYRFSLSGIYDNALVPNPMGNVDLDPFRTMFAQVSLSIGDTQNLKGIAPGSDPNNLSNRVDVDFLVEPISIDRIDEGMYWDLLIWSDTTITFSLYSRPMKDGKVDDTAEWTPVGKGIELRVDVEEQDGFAYKSMTSGIKGVAEFSPLNPDNLKDCEYAIHIEKIGANANFNSWSNTVNLKVAAVAGTQSQLRNLAAGSFLSDYMDSLAEGVSSIGVTARGEDILTIRKPFTDNTAPNLIYKQLSATVGDTAAKINVMMDRPGQVYYLVFPLTQLSIDPGADVTKDDVIETIGTNYITAVSVQEKGSGKPEAINVPTFGALDGSDAKVMELDEPNVDLIVSGGLGKDVIKNSIPIGAANASSTINLEGLTPNTVYYVCLLTRGTSISTYADNAVLFRFSTSKAVRPVLQLQVSGNSNVQATVDSTSEVYAKLMVRNTMPEIFRDPFRKHAVGNLPAAYDKDSYTVLQAMIDSVTQSGGSVNQPRPSVFDQYAEFDIKSYMEDLIRDGNLPSVIIDSKGPLTITATRQPDDTLKGSQMLNFDESKMTDEGVYTCVAMARSALGSSYSFRAAQPVQLVDDVPPRITNVSLALYKQDNGKTSGSVTIRFDKVLYLPYQDTQYPLGHQWGTGIGFTVEGPDKKEYRTLTGIYQMGAGGAAAGLPTGVVPMSMSSVYETSDLIFEFNSALGSSWDIPMPTGLCNKWGYQSVTGGKVKITYNATTDEYSYTVTPASLAVR